MVRFKIEVGVDAKFMCKDVTLNTRELPAVAGQRQPIAIAIFYSMTYISAHSGVNMLGLCNPSNLLFVLSAEERRALLKLL